MAINLMQNANLTEESRTLWKLNFWSRKLTRNSNLNEKSGKLWINKKYINFLKVYIKMEKTVKKFGGIEIQKQNFHQLKDLF